MKDISEITCLVCDSGTFMPMADMMGRKCKRTLYYSPWEQEFVNLHRCVAGDGFEHFERVDDFMHPDVLKEIDLFIFPDINLSGLQRHLRSIGKLVWGSMGADELELYRTKFIKAIKEVGLPVVNSVTIHGLSNLSEHLKGVENVWVKINRFRDNMETWHHQDHDHSQREFERLAMEFGPLKEDIIFVVQDAIDSTPDEPVVEVGYDGWCVSKDGRANFPEKSYQGFELKNKLYLGSELDYDDLPEPVKIVNESFGKILAGYEYRNFFATEIRVKGDKFYFIDPTCRMAGMTEEHLLKTCTNLPEVILRGAAGELILPEFEEPFAAEATLHYYSPNGGDGWKTFRMDKEAEPWVKLYRCCYLDGAYHFPPHKSDELGVVIGNGPTVEDSISSLKEHFELISDEPVGVELEGFAELLEDIQTSQDEGMPFSDKPMPDAAEMALK